VTCWSAKRDFIYKSEKSDIPSIQREEWSHRQCARLDSIFYGRVFSSLIPTFMMHLLLLKGGVQEVVYTHSNQCVVGGSKAEELISRAAVRDVFERKMYSQLPANLLSTQEVRITSTGVIQQVFSHALLFIIYYLCCVQHYNPVFMPDNRNDHSQNKKDLSILFTC